MHGVKVTDRLGFGDHPMLTHFRYLKGISGDVIARMTIPSPGVLHFRGGRKMIDATVYPDLEDYFNDLALTWRQAIRAFYDAGCCYLQLDDTAWAYLCSEDQQSQIREWGDCPQALAATYAEVVNKTIEGKPDYLTIGLHVCRGRFVRPGLRKADMSRWPKFFLAVSTLMLFSWNTITSVSGALSR